MCAQGHAEEADTLPALVSSPGEQSHRSGRLRWNSGGVPAAGPHVALGGLSASRNHRIGSKSDLEASLHSAQTALVMAKERVVALESANEVLRKQVPPLSAILELHTSLHALCALCMCDVLSQCRHSSGLLIRSVSGLSQSRIFFCEIVGG